MAIRCYSAYPLSYRHVEELLLERGVKVDHATTNRYVIKYAPFLLAYMHYTNNPTLELNPKEINLLQLSC